ncbi:RagB/SusD family nutrient uptake outer membrane protein [Roseivirga sp. BDSF3-8]|uniref:RagB/SusD family nutrient uptake outer membrane protein n=1 Tax=Roseivirga sp. BDSF3-8 TaxID=3241598 RepID=UPI0035322CBC
MKRFKYLLTIALISMSTYGCQDILDEQPRSDLTPDYFNTGAGVERGVNAAYAYFRYWYGSMGGMDMTDFGTDEWTEGDQANNPEVNTYLLTPASGVVSTAWNRAYPAINTCNGVIELGQDVDDLGEAELNRLIGEAKYLRAHWYFILVQQYGGVTLDLGAGPLRFNTNPTVAASRASEEEVYEAIIQDLKDAEEALPPSSSGDGRVWKASALHLLAKAYLTRAWLLDNNADYDSALMAVQRLIPDPNSPTANYGATLLSDYADVHREGNEYNNEILFSANRNGDPDYTNIEPFVGGDEQFLQNRANFYYRCFYFRDVDGLIRDVTNGRPWIRMKPTDFLLNSVFVNTDVDSRYHKSFQTVWYANDEETLPVWTESDVTAGYIDPSMVGEYKYEVGDTALYMPTFELSDLEQGRRGYVVYDPSEVAAQDDYYPSLSKHNAVERPQDGTEDNPNVGSYRPYLAHRLGETYLIGAEAALMSGNPGLAAQYINTLRRRAAYPGMESNMEITAGEVDIDFILDERSRELAGEMKRWFDLKRTEKLVERVRLYNSIAAPNIQPFHRYRPIPQDQIDLAIDPTTPDGRYPQNEGYN